MFSRNADKEPARGPEPQKPFGSTQPPAIPGTAARPAGPVSGQHGNVSVIGSDLAIIGAGLKIVSKGSLQIDGEVQGDVLGSKVIIGQSGKVTGLVNAENVLVEGSVFGTIKGVDVVLKSSARVEGDIFHQSFTLEQGAAFEGRSRRPQDRSELVPNLATSAASSSPAASSTPAAAE